MTRELRDAYEALDRARIPAWRAWSRRLKEFKKQGIEFEPAVGVATDLLLMDLKPFYNKVAEAAGFEPADP